MATTTPITQLTFVNQIAALIRNKSALDKITQANEADAFELIATFMLQETAKAVAKDSNGLVPRELNPLILPEEVDQLVALLLPSLKNTFALLGSGGSSTTPAASALTALTSFSPMYHAAVDNTGTLTYNDTTYASAAGALSRNRFAAGAIGIVQMDCPASTLTDGSSPEASTGEVILALNTDLYGPNNGILSMWWQDSNAAIQGQKNADGTTYGASNNTLLAGGKSRIRLDGTTMHVETSPNGTSWTEVTTQPQPAAPIYIQCNILGFGNQRKVTHLQASGTEVW